jgi:NAD(P)-dependent dehydrogenase (short-subunit alcohol dehydrogenase family)
MMMLTGKVILVVGGAAGIGRATAELCAARGAAVVVADRDAAGGAAVAAAMGGVFIPVDVMDATSVQALMAAVEARYGRLDALIQAAGILQGAYTPVDEFPLETWQAVIDVNLTGSFLCARYATPLLKKAGRGVILLISSVAAVNGSSSVAYGASKGGVNGLGITLANKLAPEGIRVNVVMPGNIDTTLKRSVIAVEADTSGKSLEDAIAASRLGTPEGAAKVLAWLVSDDADYVRGMISTR